MVSLRVVLAGLALAVGVGWMGKSYAAEPRKLGLLIGCSDYVANSSWQLIGAANDVIAFDKILRERFAFEDIELLYGWPTEPARRPTLDNIKQAFARLIDKAEPGSQIFILMSGHGDQVSLPADQTDWLDPSNPEPDGKDEVFLAADSDSTNQFVRDNEIGKWMDILVNEKQCHVWIVFDSCFSGTMSRGSEVFETEFPRTIKTKDVVETATVKPIAIDKAKQQSLGQRISSQLLESNSEPDKVKKPAAGSLVAFYGAQEYEEALEVIRPKGASETDPANRHGLLSFHIQQILNAQPAGLTYAQMGRLISTRYRIDGRRKPTPLYEGDLDQNVFGGAVWPGARKLLFGKTENGDWQLEAGILHGVTPGAVYDVLPLEDAVREQPLARIKTIDVGAETSSVEFVQPENSAEAALPARTKCKLVSQGLNMKKLSVKVVVASAKWDNKQQEIASLLEEASQQPEAVFKVSANDQPTDWIVSVGVTENGGKEPLVCLGNSADLTHPAILPERAPLAGYKLSDDSKKITEDVVKDLQRVFTWLRLWEIVGIYSQPSPFVASENIKVVVSRNEHGGSRELESNKVRPGDHLTLKVTNSSITPHWYSVLYLNGRYGIQSIAKGSISGRSTDESFVERLIGNPQIKGDSIGTNAFVVLSLNQREQAIQPDYSFLLQPNIGQRAGTRASIDMSKLKTPFEQLLLETQQYRGSTRGVQSDESPQFSVWSWTTDNN